MPITKCVETRRSKQINTTADVKTARREYRIWYADNANQADQYVETNLIAPITAADGETQLLISSYDLTPDSKHEGIYTAALEFSTAPDAERSEIGDETVSFDLGSQTVRTLISPQTVSSYSAAGQPAPATNGVIGASGAGQKPDGTDVFVEQFSFTVTRIFATEAITNAYISKVRDTAFRWNSVAFHGQAPGECLFAGVSGAPRDRRTYSLSFKFLCSKNKSGLAFGSISGVSKQGWDYIWARFQDKEDTNAKVLTPEPLAIYVERLYSSANFQAALGLS